MADLNSTSLASSSTSASTSYANNNYKVYDIFINHRGPDCKKTFATDIYYRLRSHGLKVFLDIEELQEGYQLTSQIQGAIRTADVHIAIFSKRYAESAWCLEELIDMLQSGKPILPIFYDVKPSDLRWSNGVYAQSLRKLQEKETIDSKTGQKEPRYDPGTITKWREALSQVADISGFDMETYNGDERKLLEEVVERVMEIVPREFHVAKYPIALDQKVEDFERKMLLQQHSEQTRIIGIVGLGGVGKTTLAKEMFNRYRVNYNRSSFLFDVREKSSGGSLKSLQSKLIKDLAQFNEEIDSIDEGIVKLRKYILSSSKALIVLDDVDHIKQMDALLWPVKDVLHSGSLIIVTSRDKGVLSRSGIVESSIYRLTGLDPKNSKELFCSHAFHQSHPVVGFEQAVNGFVKACNGLPLSLQVLGAHLHGQNDLKYWEAELRKISNTLPMDIQTTLRISYDGLDKEEKEMFLDIACFFRGEDLDKVKRIWGGSGWEGELGFRNLENKCLAEVDNTNRIRMHDHLRDLGRGVAKTRTPSRIWNGSENPVDLTFEPLPVRGISMIPNYGAESPPQSFQTRGLQLLRGEGDYVERILRVAQSPQLIWLSWYNCPYSFLPSWTPIRNLKVLEIQGSKLKTLWSRESQAPLELRELHIHGRLCDLPKSIGKLKHLEKIVLHCKDLQTLPDEFCHLKSLEHLDLSRCSEIESLPKWFGDLTKLQRIDLSNCSRLQMLPDSFGRLTNLQRIYLSGCSNLRMFPNSFCNLINLQRIDLSRCSSLQMLPDYFGNFTNLQRIDLSDCFNLQTLPNSFGNLRNLQFIYLSYCSKLHMLPDSFGNLMKIQCIDFSGCFHLQMLPESFGNLTNLHRIDFFKCSDLQMLPNSFCNLKNLQHITFINCSNFQMLPSSFGNLIQLKYLCFKSCPQLTISSETLGQIDTLQCLNISDCEKIEVLPPQVAQQRFLREMYLLCTRLKELPSDLGELLNLKILHLESKWLEMLPPSFGYLRSLEELKLHFCHRLKCLPNFVGRLTKLRILEIKEMNNLEFLETEDASEVSISLSLQHIKIEDCNGLVEVRALPTTLITLELKGCGALSKIGWLCGLPKLQMLNISGCKELEELPNIETLVSLEELCAVNCVKLKSIQGLAKLTKLRLLDVTECSELEELPGVEHLRSLVLRVDGCPKLRLGRSVVEHL